jgi:hypothetical protein
MGSDIVSRDHYLTLALFSRRILEALRDVVTTGNENRLKTALPEAIDSLQAATDPSHISGTARRALRSYEQARTINEVLPSEQERRDMIRTLKSLQRDLQPPKRRQAAIEAMKFFYAVENSALRNYRHPSPAARRTTRGLCLIQST